MFQDKSSASMPHIAGIQERGGGSSLLPPPKRSFLFFLIGTEIYLNLQTPVCANPIVSRHKKAPMHGLKQNTAPPKSSPVIVYLMLLGDSGEKAGLQDEVVCARPLSYTTGCHFNVQDAGVFH